MFCYTLYFRVYEKIAFFLLIGLLAGCATNPFAQFYQDNQIPIALQQRFLPSSGTPRIQDISGENAEEITATQQRLLEQGFVSIGAAGFIGGFPDRTLDEVKRVSLGTAICSGNSSSQFYLASL